MELNFRKFRSYRQINMKQKLPKNLVVSQKTLIFAELNIEVMARLTLQVDSPSLLEQLKNVLSLMRGVKIVSDSPCFKECYFGRCSKRRNFGSNERGREWS